MLSGVSGGRGGGCCVIFVTVELVLVTSVYGRRAAWLCRCCKGEMNNERYIVCCVCCFIIFFLFKFCLRNYAMHSVKIKILSGRTVVVFTHTRVNIIFSPTPPSVNVQITAITYFSLLRYVKTCMLYIVPALPFLITAFEYQLRVFS